MDINNVEVGKVANQPISLQVLVNTLRSTGGIAAVERGLVDYMIAQQASEKTSPVTVEELQEAADTFRQSNSLQKSADMHAWLAAQDLDLVGFESRLEHEIATNRLRQTVISDADIEQRYVSARSHLETAELSQIIVDSEGLAEELREQLDDGELDFHQAAVKYSTNEATQRGGGYLGWLPRNVMDESLAGKVFAAAEGGLIGPLAIGKQFAVVKVWSTRQPELDDAMRERLRHDAFAEWVAAEADKQGCSLTL